jgi:pyruvate dehydrogenase E1 component
MTSLDTRSPDHADGRADTALSSAGPSGTGPSGTGPSPTGPSGTRVSETAALHAIQERVLWLSTCVVDHANRVRPNPSGLKVGGHQASCASMVSLMTSLWFRHLREGDRVSVKPHASPVLHAIEYLLGRLEESSMTTLRQFGGLQSYPSRTKDPVPADYSTGSVGIGATAPIWGALSRRYVGEHFGSGGHGRQYSLVGDAELDEGAVWEAVFDPMVRELGEVVWIVDYNRQSLDRVVPTPGAPRFAAIFEAAGWQVLTVKYGAILRGLFDREGGQALKRRLDEMPNAEYQRLMRHRADELRQRVPGEGPDAETVRALLDGLDDDELLRAFRNLGGHDLGELDAAFEAIDDSRPTVILAYTLKGFGLPSEGHPQNHSALLTGEQMDALAARLGMDTASPWQRFGPGTREGELCGQAALRLTRGPSGSANRPKVPTDLGRTPTKTATTQAALGRALLDLTRAAPDVARRVVTVSPDVSSTTNLAGWINKAGVWSADEHRDWFEDDAETLLHWREHPAGQHIELGIAETNLVSLIGELGATWSRWEEPLFPIGVLYDPFVGRALEPWSFGMYAGGQSILVGTPSGVTLAPEGGAHQSITTPSIGLEQPLCTTFEPAFALETEWCLLAALGQLGRPDGSSSYLRLTTRPVDQSLAQVPADPVARERRRKQVIGGGYRLRRAAAPEAAIAAMGALVPEALEAAQRLSALGHDCDVLVITSPDLVFRASQARRGLGEGPSWIVDSLFPADRARPLVTVLDGHPHTLAFLGSLSGGPAAHLGVSTFGQSGDLAEVYRHHGIDADSIAMAVLDLLDRA